jgi:hypothetical protein
VLEAEASPGALNVGFGDCGKINQEVKPMCANADKTVHLKTLIAEIKAIYAQWKKNRIAVKPTALPTR